MGFFDKFVSKSSVTGSKLTSSGLSAYLSSTLDSSHGLSVNSEVAIRSATVFSCCNILSEDVAKLPLKLHKEEGGIRETISKKDNRLAYIVSRGINPYMTSLEFFEAMVWDLTLTGNAFAYISMANNKPFHLYPVSVSDISINVAEDGTPTYLYKGKKVERRKILHIRDKVTSTHFGQSRIKLQAEAIGLDVLGERLTGRLVKNGFRMTPVLSHPKALSKDARTRLKEQLVDTTSGDDPFKAMLLEEGLEWKPAQMTPEDAQLLGLREFQRSLIISIFRMPPHKLGILEGSSYNNIELKEREYYSGPVSSWTTRIEQAFDRDLLTDEEKKAGYYFKYNLNAMVRADMVARFNAYQIGLRNGIYNADEVRALEDMNPREDGLGGVYFQSGDLHASGENTDSQGENTQDENKT